MGKWMAVAVGVAGLAGTAALAGEAAGSGGKAGLAGSWSCVQDLGAGQTRPFDLTLQQEGDRLTGTVTATEGSASVRGTAEGDGFKLEVDADTGTYQVTGTRQGDAIGGAWALGAAQGKWEGKRKPAN